MIFFLCRKNRVMGIIATDKNELKLYYNSETTLGKQTLAYVRSSNKKVFEIDISKTKIPGSHWAEIAAGVGIAIHELIDTNHPNFIKAYGKEKVDLEEQDWLRVLEKHPETLAHPIIIDGNTFHVLKTPTDFIKFQDSDGTGQKKIL